jgi:putative phosphoribosyl transferase
MESLPFRDRKEAATRLAAALDKYRGKNPLVVAIPRGGVPIGRIVADALGGELDVVLVRKLGAPNHPEYAIGSVDEAGNIELTGYAAQAGANERYAREAANRQLEVIGRRRAQYSQDRAAIPVAGRTAIVVDDGLATGSTMIAALKALRAREPERLVCAVPVAARESLVAVSRFADEVVCLATPEPFYAVSPYYQDFSAVSDEEVVEILAARERSSSQASKAQGSTRQVVIPAGNHSLDGDLVLPPSAGGLVIFAHGSGSSRHSSRNRFVATELNQRGFATLLFDLLTTAEDRDPSRRFDIPLLAKRLEMALEWAGTEADVRDLPIGLFGASTGAAAAIIAGAARPGEAIAVVSRGGRPDLAGEYTLARVRCHVLLIVGSNDHQVLELNRMADAAMRGWSELVVVPYATHLFEEPGTLEQAANFAAGWFERWLNPGLAHRRAPGAGARASAWQR